MAAVNLRPGDTLNILWSSVQHTPFGMQRVESSFSFSYDDLVVRLRKRLNGEKVSRVGTEGARFSRIVALSTNAINKGKWSTGAAIDRNEVCDRLIKKFHQLDPREYENLTPNAILALQSLLDNSALRHSQREDLKAASVAVQGAFSEDASPTSH